MRPVATVPGDSRVYSRPGPCPHSCPQCVDSETPHFHLGVANVDDSITSTADMPHTASTELGASPVQAFQHQRTARLTRDP
jgi:hypothetical protein